MRADALSVKDPAPILARISVVMPLVQAEEKLIRKQMNEYFAIPFPIRKEIGIQYTDLREGPTAGFRIFLEDLEDVCNSTDNGTVLLSAGDLRSLERIEFDFQPNMAQYLYSVEIEKQLDKIRKHVVSREIEEEIATDEAMDELEKKHGTKYPLPAAEEKDTHTAFVVGVLAFLFISAAVFTYVG